MRIFDGKTYRDATAEELAQTEAIGRREMVEEAARPLTDSEILRMDMRRRVNNLGIDNATAGRMADCFPTRAEYCGGGELIPAGTRIRDDHDASVIWRSTVDLWNTEENGPANAPALWDKIAYHNGLRMIPDTITATLAWKLGELGWRDGHVYRSAMDGNVYLPETAEAPWEMLI